MRVFAFGLAAAGVRVFVRPAVALGARLGWRLTIFLGALAVPTFFRPLAVTGRARCALGLETFPLVVRARPLVVRDLVGFITRPRAGRAVGARWPFAAPDGARVALPAFALIGRAARRDVAFFGVVLPPALAPVPANGLSIRIGAPRMLPDRAAAGAGAAPRPRKPILEPLPRKARAPRVAAPRPIAPRTFQNRLGLCWLMRTGRLSRMSWPGVGPPAPFSRAAATGWRILR